MSAGGRSFTLTGKRLELLQAMRRERGLSPARAGGIRARGGAGAYRWSLGRRGLWFRDRRMPGKAAAKERLAMRLTGRLEPAALAAAFAGLTERHAVLRTTFDTVDGEHGEPAQRVAPPAPGPAAALPLVDGSALAADARDVWVRRLGAELARLPFDLARGPLLRVVLLRLDAGAHVALACLHHTVSDGWSLEILLREIAVLYSAAAAAAAVARPGATAAAAAGAEPAATVGSPLGETHVTSRPMPDPPIPYPDFPLLQPQSALAPR